MHQEIDDTGKVVKQVLVEANDQQELDIKLKALHAEASANPAITGVVQRRIARNTPCWCGSNLKYKKCCWPQKPRNIPDQIGG
jgi:uncharacterized protein YchJ